MNKSPMNDILGIFNKLAPQQKLMIGGIAIFTIILLGVLVSILNEPNYAVIYSNLAEEDAAKVLEHLNSKKVLYKIEDNGRTIKVPTENLYESRLQLASKGIPNSGIIGYEIFDKSTMGMSEFMQKLNYKRALEGELSRTITQQEGIIAARVHLVFPQKTIFKDEQKEPTASIVLKFNNPNAVSNESINAIVNLVSGSVEGLKRNRVTLVDTKGRLLSQQTEDSSFGVSTNKQYEIKESIEKHLTGKAQSVLDNVLGYGNAIIQVNTELNFDQVDKTMELYDPENQVIVSEQIIKTENSGSNMVDSSAQSSQNTTTNYEISKTIERVITGTGNIKRLTVAVVINDRITEVKNGEAVEKISEPRSEEELQKLEQIVRNAVGLDQQRGDEFSIVNIPFNNEPLGIGEFEEITESSPLLFDNMDKLINLILIIAAIIASLFLLKGLMKKLKSEKIIIGSYMSPDNLATANMAPSIDSGRQMSPLAVAKKREYLPVGDLEDEISDEALIKRNQNEKISNYVQKNPVDAAKLINSWLREDEY